jgi:Cu/Zn superoxide dismutase
LQGSTVQGTVTFIQEGSAVRVIADVSGLTPGKHGFHIHEFGDLTAQDGSSLGGHLNPYNSMHGGPDDKVRHLGDLGNLEGTSPAARGTTGWTPGFPCRVAAPSSGARSWSRKNRTT